MTDSYLGRQPILGADERTFAYELLFRSTETNAYDPSVDGDQATARVLVNAIVELGLERIVGDRLAFVNLTERFIGNPDLLACLPAERVVLEVLETVRPTPEVIDGVRALKAMGYTIALDDFVHAPELEPLVALADIIKYDITEHDHDALERAIARDRAEGRRTLVERVETREEFERFRAAGVDYYQGYHFARPAIVKGSTLRPDRLSLMQLLALTNDPDTSSEALVEAVSRDVSLGVKALRFVNSVGAGLRTEVTSIQHALSLLGRATLRNWIALLMMSQCDDKPAELTVVGLVRARYCQLMAQREGLADPARHFTLGLLSVLDALMDSTMDEVLDGIGASADFRAILIDGEGRAGELLRSVHALERGGELPGGDEGGRGAIGPAMLEAFQEAMIWAEETRRDMSVALGAPRADASGSRRAA